MNGFTRSGETWNIAGDVKKNNIFRQKGFASNKGKCLSRCLCQPHEVSHAGSDNNDIEFSTFSRHFDFEGSHSPETAKIATVYFAHRTWRNYCFSIRWLIVCGRTNCLVLLGVADTVKVYFLLFRWNEWKIMPLFDVIGLGSEKLAVVIDIGAAYTK